MLGYGEKCAGLQQLHGFRRPLIGLAVHENKNILWQISPWNVGQLMKFQELIYFFLSCSTSTYVRIKYIIIYLIYFETSQIKSWLYY